MGEDGAEALAGGSTRIGSGGARTLAAQLAGLATSFIVGVIVARTLGVAGKGMLSVVMQTAGLLVIVLDFGVTASMVRLLSRGDLRPGGAAANSVLIAAAAGLIGTPVAYFLLVGRFAVLQGIPALAVAAAMLVVPATVLAAGLNGVSIGLDDLALPLRAALASAAAVLVVLAVLVVTGHASVGTVAAASAFGTVVTVVVFAVGLRSRATPLRPDLRVARKAIPFSAKVHLSNVSGFLLERQDILLLALISGAHAVGLYSVGVSLAELTWYVPSALGVAIMARASQMPETSGVEYVTQTTRVALLMMAVTVAGTLVLAPFLIPLVYGSAFAPAAYACFALLPGIVVDGVTRVLWSYQTVRGRVYWLQALGATALNLALVLVLAPRFGPVGAALASTCAYSAIGVFAVRRFCRDTGASLGRVLVPGREDIHVMVRTVKGLVGLA
jgi:O-antigen/teichoic acid export membrane protein